jgi:hypothetical protein
VVAAVGVVCPVAAETAFEILLGRMEEAAETAFEIVLGSIEEMVIRIIPARLSP